MHSFSCVKQRLGTALRRAAPAYVKPPQPRSERAFTPIAQRFQQRSAEVVHQISIDRQKGHAVFQASVESNLAVRSRCRLEPPADCGGRPCAAQIKADTETVKRHFTAVAGPDVTANFHTGHEFPADWMDWALGRQPPSLQHQLDKAPCVFFGHPGHARLDDIVYDHIAVCQPDSEIASSDNNKYGFIKAVRETFVDPLWVDQGALQYPGPATTKYLAVEVATAYLNHTVQNHLRCMRTYFGMKALQELRALDVLPGYMGEVKRTMTDAFFLEQRLELPGQLEGDNDAPDVEAGYVAAAVELGDPAKSDLRRLKHARFLPSPAGFKTMPSDKQQLILQALDRLRQVVYQQAGRQRHILKEFRGRKPMEQSVTQVESTFLWQEALTAQSDVRDEIDVFLRDNPKPAPLRRGRKAPWWPERIKLFPVLQPGLVHVRFSLEDLQSDHMLGIADVTWDDVFDLGRAVGKKRSAFVSTVQTGGYDLIFNFEYPAGCNSDDPPQNPTQDANTKQDNANTKQDANTKQTPQCCDRQARFVAGSRRGQQAQSFPCQGTDDASIKQRVDWYKAFKLVWNIDPGQKCMITATDQHDNVLQIRTRAYKYRAHMGEHRAWLRRTQALNHICPLTCDGAPGVAVPVSTWLSSMPSTNPPLQSRQSAPTGTTATRVPSLRELALLASLPAQVAEAVRASQYDVVTQLAALPVDLVPRLATMPPHVLSTAVRVHYLSAGISGYLAHQVQAGYPKQHFYQHAHRQRSLMHIVKQLTTDPATGQRLSKEQVLIFYGDASVSNAGCISRHMGGAPNKALLDLLRRYATVIMVDEYRTSQFCSACVEASVADVFMQHSIPLQPSRKQGTPAKQQRRANKSAEWTAAHPGESNPRVARDPSSCLPLQLHDKLIHPEYEVYDKLPSHWSPAVVQVSPAAVPQPAPAVCSAEYTKRKAFSAVRCPCCGLWMNRDVNSSRCMGTAGKCMLIDPTGSYRPPVLQASKTEKQLRKLYTAMWHAGREHTRLQREGGEAQLNKLRADIKVELLSDGRLFEGSYEEADFCKANPLLVGLLKLAQARCRSLAVQVFGRELFRYRMPMVTPTVPADGAAPVAVGTAQPVGTAQLPPTQPVGTAQLPPTQPVGTAQLPPTQLIQAFLAAQVAQLPPAFQQQLASLPPAEQAQVLLAPLLGGLAPMQVAQQGPGATSTSSREPPSKKTRKS